MSFDVNWPIDWYLSQYIFNIDFSFPSILSKLYSSKNCFPNCEYFGKNVGRKKFYIGFNVQYMKRNLRVGGGRGVCFFGGFFWFVFVWGFFWTFGVFLQLLNEMKTRLGFEMG